MLHSLLSTSLLSISRLQKQVLSASLDAVCLPVIFILAISLRYEGFNAELFHHYLGLIVATPLISAPVFMRIGLYRAVLRFIDQKIISTILIGVSTTVFLLTFVGIMLHILPISRAIFGYYWAGAMIYLSASRFMVRGWLINAGMSDNAIPVCIYGGGKAGALLAAALKTGGEYYCVAFVDDNKHIQGSTIAGIKVYSPTDLDWLVTKREIKQILLALPSISRNRQKQILDQLEHLKLKIKVTPSIQSLVNGELRVQDIRDVEIEDLLGRDQVAPDSRLLAACITHKHVMVTGAGGSIGSELCRQIICQRPARLILLEMSEYALYTIEQELTTLRNQLALETEIIPFLGTVLDAAKLDRIFSAYHIDTLYHAAAYKHVPLVEHNPIEGIRNNVFGTLQVAQAAMRAQVRNVVLISTDKAVRPTNVMGTTKRLAELILQACANKQQTTRFCMVRFGNVLGSSGSVVPLFRKQIMEGGPITLTHPEITRYFMTIPEAAQLVLQAGAMGEGGEVFVLDMGEPVKIIDLARRMVHLSGLEIKNDSNPDGTIEIQHVGLRPGEKLFEELLIGDNVEGTSHPLIMRAQEKSIPWDQLEHFLQELEQACDTFNYTEIRTLLMKIVAEYQPQCGIEDFIWQATEGKTVDHLATSAQEDGAEKRKLRLLS